MTLRRGTLLRVAVFFLAVLTLGGFYVNLASRFELCGFFSKKEKLLSMAQHETLSLTEGQCRGLFSELTKEIDRAVARGSFILEKQPEYTTGLIQARIRNGKLYIVSADPQPSQRRTAILSQLYKAIITSPIALPDTLLAISIIDNPQENVWSFSRSNDPSIKENYWIMPHFSFWSWPKSFIGSIDEVLEKVEKIESAMPWETKSSKAVWRGTAWYNSVGDSRMRPNLIAMTKDQKWADVEDLQWSGPNSLSANNSIRIEDFCKYKYIIYTEGVTYSGRLPYHQACKSIILTPPVNYLMHTTHLMLPLFSSSLPFQPLSKSQPMNDPRWPHKFTPSEANVVFVNPDWSDLEATIAWLEENPTVAEGIANRQRELNVGAGYLSSAAEACYWRSLIKGWHSVVQPGKSWSEPSKEMRWETFSQTNNVKWE